MTTHGVITACNDDIRFRRTLMALVRSCTAKRIPITIVDQGLHPDRAIAAKKRGARIIRHGVSYSEPIKVIQQYHRGTPRAPVAAWWKPLVCLHAAPYDVNLWIDADAILLRGEDELFAMAREKGSWISRDWWVTGERTHHLYGKIIEALFEQDGLERPTDEEIQKRCHINTGVFGFRKGASWLRHWADTCERITRDRWLLSLCKCRDQTGLAAWMARGSDESPFIVEDERWNYPANGLPAGRRIERKKYRRGLDLLEEATKDHPKAYVVHWLGSPKP